MHARGLSCRAGMSCCPLVICRGGVRGRRWRRYSGVISVGRRIVATDAAAFSFQGRPSPMSLFPLFADLRSRAALVVGGGVVAERKVRALAEAGADITVGAPALTAWLTDEVAAGRIQHLAGTFDASWLAQTWLVIAATDQATVNREVAAAAQAQRVFVNVVDDAGLSSFHVPAVVDRAPLVVAISSGGTAPALARDVRARIEALLEPSLGTLAGLAERWRARIKRRLPDLAERRRFYARVVLGAVARAVGRNRVGEAERTLADALQPNAIRETRGSVVLVGAGPGDPNLLTLGALRALGEADVILHDRLVSDDVLSLARRDAERIDVGKRAGGPCTGQDHIHALMLEHARAGRRVVRLKGGDPFVFGRGGEELQFLRRHRIEYSVVPGITAAMACAAYAGIPLTHRDHAQALHLATAHGRDHLETLDWHALARDGQTLAFYMGVAGLETVRGRLLALGRAANTPIALIENGTRAEQRVIVGTLADLPDCARRHAVRVPALLIVGAVAALAQQLHWFGTAPLSARPADTARAA